MYFSVILSSKHLYTFRTSIHNSLDLLAMTIIGLLPVSQDKYFAFLRNHLVDEKSEMLIIKNTIKSVVATLVNHNLNKSMMTKYLP